MTGMRALCGPAEKGPLAAWQLPAMQGVKADIDFEPVGTRLSPSLIGAPRWMHLTNMSRRPYYYSLMRL